MVEDEVVATVNSARDDFRLKDFQPCLPQPPLSFASANQTVAK
jgi:hypothetical protein